MEKNIKIYSTAEASRKLNVSRDTLLRWFRENRIGPVPRDRRGWRTFSEEDILRIMKEIELFDRAKFTLSIYKSDQLKLFEVDSLLEPLSENPVRLIQYLGSKVRVLPQLLPHLKHYTPEGGVFFDLFGGTTTVGQAMLDHSTVVTNDSMIYSKLFGDVLIVGPSSSDFPIPDCSLIFESEAYINNKTKLVGIYSDYVRQEEELLSSFDYEEHYKFCVEFPTCWKYQNRASRKIKRFLEGLPFPSERQTIDFNPACLFTAYYSGSYFGIAQCIEIDSCRIAIRKLEEHGSLSAWQAKAFLCALMSAMSHCVSTAGKHFAQPILIPESKDQKTFAKKRCLSDRKLTIKDKFNEIVALLNRKKFSNQKGRNRSLMIEFEEIHKQFIKKNRISEFSKRHLQHLNIDTLYVDPPYTAQQYSRFYHILETVCKYDYPPLQKGRNGQGITKGIYRDNRHYSSFCKKETALSSFEGLFELSSNLNSNLIISYSESRSNTGNKRMVTPNELSEIAKKQKFSEDFLNLEHNYKPLNNIANKIGYSDEVEKLYFFTPRNK